VLDYRLHKLSATSAVQSKNRNHDSCFPELSVASDSGNDSVIRGVIIRIIMCNYF